MKVKNCACSSEWVQWVLSVYRWHGDRCQYICANPTKTHGEGIIIQGATNRRLAGCGRLLRTAGIRWGRAATERKMFKVPDPVSGMAESLPWGWDKNLQNGGGGNVGPGELVIACKSYCTAGVPPWEDPAGVIAASETTAHDTDQCNTGIQGNAANIQTQSKRG